MHRMIAWRSLIFAIAIVLPTASWAYRLGGGSAPAISLIRIGAAFILCCLVAFAVIVLMRARSGQPLRFSVEGLRWFNLAVTNRVEVVESRRLSAHADACLLRCDDRDYFVICGVGGMLLLSECEAEEVAAISDNIGADHP